MGLFKYLDESGQEDNRGKLSFGRVIEDGMPFRGKSMPLLKQAEFEEFTETVYDAGSGVFDLSDPVQHAKLDVILDRSSNGWYRIYMHDHRWVRKPDGAWTVNFFVIWSMPVKELNPQRLPPGVNANAIMHAEPGAQ